MSTVLTGVMSRLASNQKHLFETLKSSPSQRRIHSFSASMGSLLEWSAISQPTAEEVKERSIDAACRCFFRISVLKKSANIGGIFSWKMPQDNQSFCFSGQFVGLDGRQR